MPTTSLLLYTTFLWCKIFCVCIPHWKSEWIDNRNCRQSRGKDSRTYAYSFVYLFQVIWNDSYYSMNVKTVLPIMLLREVLTHSALSGTQKIQKTIYRGPKWLYCLEHCSYFVFVFPASFRRKSYYVSVLASSFK